MLPIKIKRLLAIVVFICCCQVQWFLFSDSASGAEMTKRVSLDLRNIEVLEALKFLAMKAGLNIVATKKVGGRVTLNVENVPVQDIFDVMLRSNGLAYAKEGDIYNVMTESEYKALYGKNFSDTRQVKVFRLKYAIPQQVFGLLDAIKSDIGRILVDQESGTIMIMDTPDKIKQAQEALHSLEQKSTIRMFTLKYARAKDVEKQLKSQLDLKKVGSIKADERANQIIVQTLPERMKDIEALVKGLDQKTKQVLVDIKIVKIKLSDQLDTGLQWEGIFNIARQYGMTYLGSYPFSAVQTSSDTWRSRETVLSDLSNSVGSYPFSGTINSVDDFASGTKIKPGEKMHIGIVDRKRDFDTLIKYLQTLGKTKILSNPKIAVINNEEAKVHVGERRAYVTTTTTLGTTTKTVAEEVTYVDIGVQLSLTAMINDEGYVTMKIKPEISSVTGNVTSSEGNVIPIIDTSTAETTVMVKDGATVVLAGLGKEEKTETTYQVPILSKIPLLGFLFRSSTQKLERNELVIMLTPIIFGGEALVTAKDKENELFGIKSAKRFDVFREESPTPSVTGLNKMRLAPKGFKAYSLGKD
jgi:type II secretory pathway component GspD/PulD (secretin)